MVDAEFLDMYGGHFDPANLPAINSTTIGVTWVSLLLLLLLSRASTSAHMTLMTPR